MKFFRDLWQFMGLTHPRNISILHASLILLVLIMWLSGEGTSPKHLRGTGRGLHIFLSWLHVSMGFITIVVGTTFIDWALSKRGKSHYFSMNEETGSKVLEDMGDCARMHYARPRPSGLRALWHGVGFVAFAGTVVTAGLWFLSWVMHIRGLRKVLHAHEFFAWVFLIYALVHAFFALQHFVHLR